MCKLSSPFLQDPHRFSATPPPLPYRLPYRKQPDCPDTSLRSRAAEKHPIRLKFSFASARSIEYTFPAPQQGAEATRANGEGYLTPDAQNAAEGAQSAEKTAPAEGTAKPNYNILEADAIRREGKTFRNLVAGFDTSVSAFFDKWSGGRKNGQGEKLEKLYLGMLTDAQRKAVSDILGYPVSERNVIVTNDDVRHILREHGSPEAELRKGNLPLERWAIDALPEVVTQPDSITPGEVQVGGKNDGKRGVLLSKSMPDGKVITVQFDNKGRGTMEITTMYVKENSGDFTQTLNVEEASPQLTAEPVSGPVSPAIENSISSNGENVKRGMIEPRTLYIRKRTPQDTVSNTETTSALNSNVRNVPPQEFSSADSVAHGSDPVNTQDMRSAREYAPDRHIDIHFSCTVKSELLSLPPQKLAKTLQLFDRGKHPPEGIRALRTHCRAKYGVLRL